VKRSIFGFFGSMTPGIGKGNGKAAFLSGISAGKASLGGDFRGLRKGKRPSERKVLGQHFVLYHSNKMRLNAKTPSMAFFFWQRVMGNRKSHPTKIPMRPARLIPPDE
jgi:hypothetical protein